MSTYTLADYLEQVAYAARVWEESNGTIVDSGKFIMLRGAAKNLPMAQVNLLTQVWEAALQWPRPEPDWDGEVAEIGPGTPEAGEWVELKLDILVDELQDWNGDPQAFINEHLDAIMAGAQQKIVSHFTPQERAKFTVHTILVGEQVLGWGGKVIHPAEVRIEGWLGKSS